MKSNVVRWTPFRELNQLQQEMNRLFDGTVLDWRNGEPADVSVWAPLVDILESEDAIVLKAELPEVDPQSVDIRLENNVLTLKGDRQFEGDSQKGDSCAASGRMGRLAGPSRCPPSLMRPTLRPNSRMAF